MSATTPALTEQERSDRRNARRRARRFAAARQRICEHAVYTFRNSMWGASGDPADATPRAVARQAEALYGTHKYFQIDEQPITDAEAQAAIDAVNARD